MSILGRLLDWIRKNGGAVPTPPPRPVPVPVPPPPSPPLAGLAAAINAERLKFGRAPLAENPLLDQLAQSWAGSMAARRTMTHGAFGSRIAAVFPSTADAEDIAEGQPTVEAVVAAWMNSAGHRANILGAYDAIGVGEAADAGGTIYWCVDFARLH